MMPWLKSSDEMIAHLRGVAEGDDRVALVTDHTPGHLALVALAVGLGDGDRGADLQFGALSFYNPPTGHRDNFSVLTAPRGLVTPDRLAAVWRAAGGGAAWVAGWMFGLPEDPAQTGGMVCFRLAVERRALWPRSAIETN